MPGCAAIAVILWVIFGRDKKTIPAITTGPPEGMDPLEMEYAQIVTITDRGIFAELLYWASEGLLKIRNEGGRTGMEKAGKLQEDAPEHASFLFQRLFQKSDVVWLDSFPAEVSDHKGELRDKVGERFKGRNAVVQDDSMAVTLAALGILIVSIFVVEVAADVNVFFSAFLGAVLFVTAVFLQNGALGFRSKYVRFELVFGGAGTAAVLIIHMILLKLHTDTLFVCVFAVCFLICIPCIIFMERRVNHRIYGQILGFRQFIETAEWDRLKQLSEDDPDYGMDILPYAMLFNMGTKWTAGFENKTICTCVEKMEEMAQQEQTKQKD